MHDYVARVAVFDSGLGSLSIIRAIQRAVRAEIIYFADQKNFPYGTKTKSQLDRIIARTIKRLEDYFDPDVIVMASNTPSLVLKRNRRVIGVYPPLKEAARISATQNIAVLATTTTINSRGLDDYIRAQGLASDVVVHKIDASHLVELVEAGRFLTDHAACQTRVGNLVEGLIADSVDAATLTSTHLPFLKPFFACGFPDVTFLDPANSVASEVARRINPSRFHRLQAYTSGDVAKFEASLAGLGMHSRARHLTA